jgi:hypothetical protein
MSRSLLVFTAARFWPETAVKAQLVAGRPDTFGGYMLSELTSSSPTMK